MKRRNAVVVRGVTLYFGIARPRPTESLVKCVYFIVEKGVIRHLTDPPWIVSCCVFPEA